MDEEYRHLSNQSTGGGRKVGKLPRGSVCDSSLQSTIIKSSTERVSVLLSGSRTVTLQAQSGTQISGCWEFKIIPFSREPPVIRDCTIVPPRGPSSCYCHFSSFATAGPAEKVTTTVEVMSRDGSARSVPCPHSPNFFITGKGKLINGAWREFCFCPDTRRNKREEELR